MIKIEALYKEVDLWLWQLCLRESAATKNYFGFFFFFSNTGITLPIFLLRLFKSLCATNSTQNKQCRLTAKHSKL